MGHGDDQHQLGGTVQWVCTACGERATVEPTPLIDGSYGSARCISSICKREKRIFHKEVNRDDRPVHL